MISSSNQFTEKKGSKTITEYAREKQWNKATNLYLPDHGQFINGETRTQEVHNALDLVTVLGLVNVACIKTHAVSITTDIKQSQK